MAKFHIKQDDLRVQIDEFKKIEMNLQNTYDSMISIHNSLRSVGSFSSMLDRAIKNNEDSIEMLENETSNMYEALDLILYRYQETEKRILENGLQKNRSDESTDSGGEAASSEEESANSIAWISGAMSGTGAIGSVSLAGTLYGELFGASYDTKCGIQFKKKENNGALEFDSLGIEASAAGEIHGIKGSAEGNIGYLSGKAEAEIGKISGTAAVGASLFKDGMLSPQIYGKIKAEAEGVAGSAKASFGTENTNAHVKAKGTLGKAKASAEAGIGMITYEKNGRQVTEAGIRGNIGAEAYVAEGKVSGGITILGIDIDVGIGGKAGGAGVKAGGQVTTGGVSGSIGAGLGLGLDLDISIDWTDFKFGW